MENDAFDNTMLKMSNLKAKILHSFADDEGPFSLYLWLNYDTTAAEPASWEKKSTQQIRRKASLDLCIQKTSVKFSSLASKAFF